jgi:hypothetical protein
MGRFDLKLNADQREAIIRAKADAGLTAREVVELAADGLDGLKPFEVSETVVNDLVREERQERGHTDPPNIDAVDDVRAHAEAQLARLKQIEEPSPRELTRSAKRCGRSGSATAKPPSSGSPAAEGEPDQAVRVHATSALPDSRTPEVRGGRAPPVPMLTELLPESAAIQRYALGETSRSALSRVLSLTRDVAAGARARVRGLRG